MSEAPQYLSLSQFKTDNLLPGSKEPTLFKNGGKFLPFEYKYPNNQHEKLNIVTPDVYLPFGLSCFQTATNSRWTCDISFYKREENLNLQRLYDVAYELDEFAINLVHKNSENWFGKQKSLEVLRENYSKLIRESKPPGKFAPVLRVHANPDPDNNFKFKIFNKQGKLLPCSADVRETSTVVPRMTKARLLLEFSSLWFSGVSFGWSCNVKQLIVIPFNSVIEEPIINSVEYNEEGKIEEISPMETDFGQEEFIET